jgi:3-deoxy-D-manno-octulosonic-acid transferase
MVENFTAVYERFVAAGGARMVEDAGALAEAVGDWLADPQACRRAGGAAAAVATEEAAVIDRVMDALAPLLRPLQADAPGAGDARA